MKFAESTQNFSQKTNKILLKIYDAAVLAYSMDS